MKFARWRNPVVQQWLLMLLVLSAATGACSFYGVFWRIDFALYDAALPTRPAPKDIVIVAIDDASIDALGRWPWRRTLHAAMLDRLHAMGAKAVALDVLLTEPDAAAPQDDAALAAAMTRGPPTVLPLLMEVTGPARRIRERLPIPLFAQAAAGMGHAHLELDRDGVVRSVFVTEGLGAPHWRHFAAALLDVAPGSPRIVLQGARHPDLPGAPDVWVRDHQMWIPFLGPPGTFQQISYVDVLRGKVANGALRGKLVLVGATAQGVGDAYPTPRSGEGRDMAGVEITANVLQGLRQSTWISTLRPWMGVVLSLAPVVVAALALLLLAPSQSLAVVCVSAVGSAFMSVCLLRGVGWWWPPGAALVGLLVMYPFWSWRRLLVTQAFLEEEFRQLADERFPLLNALPAPTATASPIDFVEQRIALLRQATHRLRNVRRLFSDIIGNLPDATVLVDEAGSIVLANHAAVSLFGGAHVGDIEDTPVDRQLFARVGTDESRFAELALRAPCTVEAAFADAQRHVLIRAVPFSANGSRRIGTILALADITELRAVQAERDDVLRFLSHDMKSPASSLLGLAQLQRDSLRALSATELSARLELLAQRLLTLVDGFVSLARAGAVDRRAFEEFDMGDAVRDAYDEVWASARAVNVTLNVTVPDDPVVVLGDRQLLARAVANLLSNAVKFSAPGTTVDVLCRHTPDHALVTVADHGPGIDAAAATRLFLRFSRGLHRGSADPGGAGLGLAFVRVVAEKHQGRAWVASGEGYGAVFCLEVPARP